MLLKGSPRVRFQLAVRTSSTGEPSAAQTGGLLTFPGPAGGAAGTHCGEGGTISDSPPPDRNQPQANREAQEKCGGLSVFSRGVPWMWASAETPRPGGGHSRPSSSWALANALTWHRGQFLDPAAPGRAGVGVKISSGKYPGPDRCPSSVHLPVQNDLCEPTD